MPNIIYGDGSLYGSVGFDYGRIHPDLSFAQLQKVRETGLRVSVLDEHLNDWEHVAGTHLFEEGLGAGLYLPLNAGIAKHDPAYYAFRGNSSMCVLGNGNIYRARIGNPTDGADRQVWDQTITDPTNASQWTSWAVLYSGTHYGVTVISDGTASGKIVYHSKSDGMYRNNVQEWAPNPNLGKVLDWSPVVGEPDAGWVITLIADFVDGKRIGDAWYTPDLVSTTPEFDQGNFGWYRGAGSAIKDAEGKYTRLSAHPIHFNPRDADHGIAIYHQIMDPANLEMTPPFVIRGVGGGAGRNYITALSIQQFSDGYYYMFGLEVHQDNSLDGVTNLGYGLPVWMRSKNLKHWSDQVVGPAVMNAWGVGEVVETNGFIYWADIEVVYRRAIGTTTIDLSNFIPTLEFNLPRDNQPGTGRCVVANPAGINDALLALSDREIVIEPGLRVEDGTYQFRQFDRFFIKQCNKELEGGVNRINIEFGNVWDRLDTDFRDVTNHIGQTDWKDWLPGKRNKAFNYFFVTDTAPVETEDGRLVTSGIVLYTGWKGHNPDVTARFSGLAGTARLVTKYVNTLNYSYFEYDPSDGDLTYNEVIEGVESLGLDSWSTVADSNPKIRVQLRWTRYRVWINDEEFSHADQWFPEPLESSRMPGYVGFWSQGGLYTISGFELTDWEAPITSEDLVRTALAMGDFHDVIVGGATSRVYALTWGPQTDAPTKAVALKQTLEIDKLQLIWRDGFVEVGKFHDQTPIRTIQDEVIQADQIDEAKRRINLAAIDGNEHHWIEVDTEDTNQRGRQISAYFDLPELLDEDAVIERSREEIRQGTAGKSPGGMTPLFFDLYRMDAVTWIDNSGESQLVRIEGFEVTINQSKEPTQHQKFDTSLYSDGSSDGLIGREVIVEGNP